MKYLLHGDDIAASRKFLNTLTDGFVITQLDGKVLSLPVLEEALIATSLFDEKKAVIIENLFSKNKKKKELVEFINTKKTEFLVIFWEDRKVIKTAFKDLKDLNVREFLLPQNYFQFLDGFVPGNKKREYNLYKEMEKTMGEEIVFYSLLKRLRQLLIVASDGYQNISEFQKMSPWQLDKLKKQLKVWKTNQLFTTYSKLQDIEIKMKSGALATGLSHQLEILILSDL